jgi:hypothetical protein
MKFPKRTFRILLPSVYVVVGLLPIVGIIITIAEGPNPFDFLFVASYPGLWLLDVIDRRLVNLPAIPGLVEWLVVVVVNVPIYFLIGWALDAIVNRYWQRKPILPILILLVSSVNTFGQTKSYVSAHKGIQALVVPVGTESRVEVRSSTGVLLRRRNFTSPDQQHGERVDHVEWTADGRFLVFTTSSSGGHQPWHVATYFYSVSRNRFYSLDAIVGATVSDFALRGDVLTTTRLGATPEDRQLVTVYLHRRDGGYSYRSVTNGSTRVARRAGR